MSAGAGGAGGMLEAPSRQGTNESANARSQDAVPRSETSPHLHHYERALRDIEGGEANQAQHVLPLEQTFTGTTNPFLSGQQASQPGLRAAMQPLPNDGTMNGHANSSGADIFGRNMDLQHSHNPFAQPPTAGLQGREPLHPSAPMRTDSERSTGSDAEFNRILMDGDMHVDNVNGPAYSEYSHTRVGNPFDEFITPSQSDPPPPPPPRRESHSLPLLVDVEGPTSVASPQVLEERYQIKMITFSVNQSSSPSQRVPILVQQRNGPCPLIALVNALVLTTPASGTTSTLTGILRESNSISLAELLEGVVDEFFSRGVATTLSDPQLMYQFLGNLHTGMNVNPRYIPSDEAANAIKRTSMSHLHPSERDDLIPGTFEPTSELEHYLEFGIPFVHGWIPRRSDPAYDAFAKWAPSYDAFQDLLVREERLEEKLDGGVEPVTDDELMLYGGMTIIKGFLNTSATQLTPWGLEVITRTVEPGKIAILFRNDHFSTLYRHPDTLQLFQLVTDAGFAGHSDIVWESLNDVDGRAEFFSSAFQVVGGDGDVRRNGAESSNMDTDGFDAATAALANLYGSDEPSLARLEQEDGDLALATRLQEEEDARANREAERPQDTGPPPRQNPGQQPLQHPQPRSGLGPNQRGRADTQRVPPNSQWGRNPNNGGRASSRNSQSIRDRAFSLRAPLAPTRVSSTTAQPTRVYSTTTQPTRAFSTAVQPTRIRAPSSSMPQTPQAQTQQPPPAQTPQAQQTPRPAAPFTYRQEDQNDDAPPSYEHASKQKPFHPPVGHPSHPGSSAVPQSPHAPPTPPTLQTPRTPQTPQMGQPSARTSRQSVASAAGSLSTPQGNTSLHTPSGNRGSARTAQGGSTRASSRSPGRPPSRLQSGSARQQNSSPGSRLMDHQSFSQMSAVMERERIERWERDTEAMRREGKGDCVVM